MKRLCAIEIKERSLFLSYEFGTEERELGLKEKLRASDVQQEEFKMMQTLV